MKQTMRTEDVAVAYQACQQLQGLKMEGHMAMDGQ